MVRAERVRVSAFIEVPGCRERYMYIENCLLTFSLEKCQNEQNCLLVDPEAVRNALAFEFARICRCAFTSLKISKIHSL